MENVFGSLILFSLLSMIAKGDDRPNIVFILADDLGFNDIGYHARNHGSDIKTPFLDQLAENGIKLENYYVQPKCTPTRGQLMTGRYSVNNRMQNHVIWPSDRKALPLENKILPQQLKSCGYDTHMVGKWHLGHSKREHLPQERGFNSYFGLITGSGDYYTHKRCYKGMCGVDMHDSSIGPVNDTWGEYSAHLFARKSIEAIKKRDPTKPFFLYLSYQSVHIPLQVPKKYQDAFKHIKHRRRRKYAGMVLAMDESVRNVTQYFKEAELMNNTIIVFSTDNGGVRSSGNNWPLRGAKRSYWEGGVRAVGFVHGKPLGVRGTIYNGLLDVSDWFPTFLRVGGCTAIQGTQPLDGFNQWDALQQKEPSPRSEILHTVGPARRRKSNNILHGFDIRFTAAIRVGPWKLITGDPGKSGWFEPPESGGPVGPFEKASGPLLRLFNIESDPSERNNVAAQQPTVVRHILQRLKEFQLSIPEPLRSKLDPQSNPIYHGGFWVPWINNTDTGVKQ